MSYQLSLISHSVTLITSATYQCNDPENYIVPPPHCFSDCSAFSTTLGSISNSPSACFVASDGTSLRVYQAVIDARTLLAEINTATRQSAAAAGAAAHNPANPFGAMQSSFMSVSSGHSTNDALLAAHAESAARLQNRFHIVSTQSTAKPGAIIELEPIKEATQVRLLNEYVDLLSFAGYPMQRFSRSTRA